MTKFKFGAPKVEPPPQELDCAEIERIKLKHPGEVRCAIIAGDLFELYIKRFVEGYCYQVIPDKSSGKIVVHGMVRGPIELPLGELIQDKITGEWHYKGERRDHPDWSTFNQIFHRFWNLLERGCRIQPGTEVFKLV